MLAVFIRALFAFERRGARRRGIPSGSGGAITAIQRCGSALNINVHFHTLLVEGVFAEHAAHPLDQACPVRFFPAPPPTDLEVARLLASIRRRVIRLVKRQGIDLEHPSDEVHPADPLAEDSPALAEICGASVLGRVATGRRAGLPVLRVGCDPNAEWVFSSGPRHAHIEGFDLHAGVAVPAGDRARLVNLCRYVLRPPVAQDALELTAEGKVLLHLRRPWHDGTRAILFEPLELLEKLAVLVARPRVNLLLYHGHLGPAARARREALATTRAPSGCAQIGASEPSHGEAAGPNLGQSDAVPTPSAAVQPRASGGAIADLATPAPSEDRGSPPSPPNERPRYYSWSQLMARAFEVDVLECISCGGRLRLIATIDNPDVVRKILAHLGLPTEIPAPLPARSPPQALEAENHLQLDLVGI